MEQFTRADMMDAYARGYREGYDEGIEDTAEHLLSTLEGVEDEAA